ncbi:Uncharacterised protein [Mycobacterium tuberculosis]|nr:Uncharacterised protein [Mycobacterium tuberculosis]COY25163.1 Uncharacterised protein [Mycobacterium tuberculosis]
MPAPTISTSTCSMLADCSECTAYFLFGRRLTRDFVVNRGWCASPNSLCTSTRP